MDPSTLDAVSGEGPANTPPPTDPSSAPTSSGMKDESQPNNSPAPAGATPAPTATPAAPTVVRPVHRTGLAGLVDEIRDALAGTTTPKIYEDPKTGDKYVKDEQMSHGQQWRRIAGDALRGAAAGLGVRKNQALQAGFESQDRVSLQRQQDRKNANAEVRQANLDHYNNIKLKHDIAASDFSLTRMKVQATENDVKYSQEQQDRERTLGSADLGIYATPDALAEVKKQDPDFWKNVYSNRIVTVPEIAPDGTRKGIHVYLRTQGVGNEQVPKGTKVIQFTPGAKPGDPPTLTQRELNGPATHDQVDAWNSAAQKKYQDYLKEESERKFKESEVIKNKAEANKYNAEAESTRLTSKQIQEGGDEVTKEISSGLATGRYLAGKDIPLRTSKGQKGADAYAKAANDYSMAHFGLPYSPELIRQEAHLAEDKKTQSFLTGIDRMVGVAGIPGQLDQVLDLAKKAGVTNRNAPLNETILWVKQVYGSTAAKNFEEGLSDTQTALGTLIGNPLLGSGESDLKLKTAQKQFGKNVTLDNLVGAVQTTKDILSRARQDLARNNRYIQQRYGEQFSPTPAAQQTTGLGVSLADARNLPQNKGKSDDQIRQDIKAHGHAVIE